MNEPAFVVTLVHGTFAQNAEWARPGSDFSMSLANELKGPIVVKSFNWSGANNHEARFTAAKGLVESLSSTLDEFPSSEHFVIAHSHGGNVAFRAQGDEAIRSRLAGIITLGTPFISCRERDMKSGADSVVLTASIFIAVALSVIYFYALLYILFDLASSGTQRALYGFTTVMVSWLAGGFVMPRWRRMMRFFRMRLKRRIRRYQERAKEQFSVDISAVPPMFCINVLDDEASRWLSLLRVIGNLGPAIARPISTIMRIVIAIYTAGFVISIVLSTFFKYTLVGIVGLFGLGFFILAPMALAVVFLLVQFCTVISQMLIRAHRFGFGGESIADNWFSDIYVSNTPNEVTCMTYSITSERAGLHHSSFYKESGVVKVISQWMTAGQPIKGTSNSAR